MVGTLKKFGASKCLVSADDHQRDLFWSGRKMLFLRLEDFRRITIV